jgi:ketosteroid isomerase-like protein
VSAQAPSDSAAVAAIIQAFHAALASGDSAAALALLAPDVLVLEAGGLETLADYRAHHLPADISFAQAVPGSRTTVRIVVRGDVAWAVSTSQATGTFRDRPVNSSGAELMVLSREPAGWRIRAIHWSSRARRATPGGP